MAELIVAEFTEALSQLLMQQASKLLGDGVEEELVLLRDELEWIRHFLKDADSKRRDGPLVEHWVSRIRDLVSEAEDLLDTYMLHLANPHHLRFKNSMTMTRYRIAQELKDFNQRARKISKARSDYNLQAAEQTHDSSNEDITWRRKSIFNLRGVDIVGFQKESAQLINWLKDGTPEHQIMSVTGMGGLGKTTLARVTFNSEHVTKFFTVRVWISVSQVFHLRGILLRALQEVIGDVTPRGEDTNDEQLLQQLHRELEHKNFLVVIDDIWKVEDWDQIRHAFPNGWGSKIILTTRHREVALHADPSSIIDLGLLNEDESWELLCREVFFSSGGICPPELANLGTQLVKKCSNLPLAIVVLSGILKGRERSQDEWFHVLQNTYWEFSREKNTCRKILILSYMDLPHYLKSCFLYLGLFPEDDEIEVRKLVLLWVAEGFVQGRGDVMIEDVAEDYLEELIQRSLVQVKETMYEGGSVTKCQVHDLLRDVALSEARKDGFLDIQTDEYRPSVSPIKPRRLAIHSVPSTGQEDPISQPIASKLRSLVVFDGAFKISKSWKSTFGDGKKVLRVLELEGVKIKWGLPKEIGMLIFLQYLGLCYTGITSLPSSIGNLSELQTLDVRNTHVHELPKAMWKLNSIRHLFLNELCQRFEKERYEKMEDFCLNLITLEATREVWLGDDIYDDVDSAGCHLIKTGHDAPFETGTRNAGLSGALIKLDYLRSLTIYGAIVVSEDCFPSTLTELHLENSKLQGDPSDILGRLQQLKVLVLGEQSLGRTILNFRSGGFPRLQFLRLEKLPYLNSWEMEDGAAPVLRHLRIYECEALKKLPSGLKNLASLQKIELELMPKQFRERAMENGEDWDIIKHVPSIINH